MHIAEAFRFSFDTLRSNKTRTFLTALGLVIGNASVILVVTISLTSTDYILDQIRGIGSNIIYGNYEAGSNANYNADADYIKWADVEGVRRQFESQIVAATGVMTVFDRMLVNGREEDIAIIGTDESYRSVRNLIVFPPGRFMSQPDVALRQRVAMLTEKLAIRLYGSRTSALGQIIKLHQLQFTVIGVFKEKTESFGLSELTAETVVIPATVLKYFAQVEKIDPLYVQVRRANDVPAVTNSVKQYIESRHRPGARYNFFNLTAILDAANKIALILTLVLVLVSTIALIISGIGIMNIMLVTVTERTREIGIRMAIGASRREVLVQFLLEAVIISVGGGLVGILAGISLPLSVGFLTDAIDIRVSPISIGVAFVVSFVVGLVFGLLPANRASRLNPTEALRYE
jgi:putative ABC transport system permease protein